MSNTKGKAPVEFTSCVMDILYMRLEEGKYEIRGVIDGNTDAGADTINHILALNPDKVANRYVKGPKKGQLIGATEKHAAVNFRTNYEPVIVNEEGQEFSPGWFDGRTDSGKAIVTYSVKNVNGKNYINLKGAKLFDLDITPKEEFDAEGAAAKAKERIKALLAQASTGA